VVKVYALIPKRPDISAQRFHVHWRVPHGELARNVRTARRYVQAHRVAYPGLELPSGPYDGVAEIWFDDRDDALGVPSNPDYNRYLVPDEPAFIHMPGLRFLLADERVLVEGESIDADARLFKLIQLVGRSDSAGREEFGERWTAELERQDLGSALDVTRCVAATVAADGFGPPAFDGVLELWWPDEDAFHVARANAREIWRQVVLGPRIDPGASLMLAVDEIRIVWPQVGPAARAAVPVRDRPRGRRPS
jgi:EthD domain